MDADIVADVRLNRTDQGGREGPILRNVFRCIMVVDGRCHDVRLRTQPPFGPGEQRRVGMDFLDQNAATRLRPGTPFKLREAREIGEGAVVSVRAASVVA